MNTNHGGSSIPGVPTHVYLLQMDSSINLSSNEQVLPLHLLDNSLDYCRSPYLSPLQTIEARRDVQDRLHELIGPCQEPAKVMGFLVEKSYRNTENQLGVLNDKSQTLLCDTKHLSEILGPELIKSELNSVNVNSTCVKANRYPKNYVQILDRVVLPRALAVLPSILQVQRREIITARRALPKLARFGPVQGIRSTISHSEAVQLVLNATSSKKPLFLLKNNDLITHVDVSDKDKSNWISLLPLGDQTTANVWLYEENNDLYAISTDIIPLRKPLMLGYSKTYADTYGLIGPTKDIELETQSHTPALWCSECQRALPSAKILQRHIDTYHKDDKVVSRRRYRCRDCSRTFSRIFSLRRHKLIHCPNKPEKRPNVTSVKLEPQILNTTSCSEDNRIPSDESFQNYSNGLDFSTNLFDTDRIPNLDISGSSRSDNDFNPYGIGYKDENCANGLDFSIKNENAPNVSKDAEKTLEQLLLSCPYCKQVLTKGNRRQHLSECPGRRFECECKKIFTSKKKLAQHIFIQHSNESSAQNNTENTTATATEITTNSPQDSTLYKCEQCEHTFKRRGMLVNHLWRVHNTVSAKVPLERRVRHYPCGICPKIYRTAAKRDRHVHLHHPGAPGTRAAVEGGTRVCEPAACAACPRQYVTRAKLLQHQRAAHPHLAPLTNTKPKSTNNKNNADKSNEAMSTFLVK